MINLEVGTLSIKGVSEKIDKFVVWWQTPMGLIDDFHMVRELCREHDMDINMVARPVVVAMSENNYEIIGM